MDLYLDTAMVFKNGSAPYLHPGKIVAEAYDFHYYCVTFLMLVCFNSRWRIF